MSPSSGRYSPSWRFWLLCRCGGHVNLPAFGAASFVCRCGRRYVHDCSTIWISRPDGRWGAVG